MSQAEGDQDGLAAIEAEARARWSLSEALILHRFGPMAPGDAIFFDFLTVHGAPGFPYAARRRVLSLRYLAADAVHAPRDWVTSPPFEDILGIVPAGAPMDHPLFPVVG